MIRWAAVICVSLSWLFAFHHYVVPVPAMQWAWVGAGWALATFGLQRCAGHMRMSPMHLLLLIPLAIVFTLADAPYWPGICLLAVGVVGSCVARLGAPWRWLQPMSLSGVVLGTILIAQGPCYWAVSAFTARSIEVPMVGSVVYTILAWLGADVSFSGGTLYCRMMREVHAFPVNWAQIGLLPLLALWVGGIMAVAWQVRTAHLLRAVVRLTWVLLAYAVARLTIMVLVFVSAMLFVKHEQDIVRVELFWMPWISALSWLPLSAVLAGLLPWPSYGGAGVQRSGRWDARPQRAAGVLAGCVACAGVVLCAYFPDPGTIKQGRILLDESHSQWERTDNEFDTEWYGHESVYNYYCMAQYLGHYYELDFNMDDELTPHMLEKYDVLILKTPTDPYSESELDAIEDFVQAGGGLFALGEHTNVFGSSVFLNPVVKRFGMMFRYDSVFEIERKWEQVHLPGQRLVRRGPREAEPQIDAATLQRDPQARTWLTGGDGKLAARSALLNYVKEMTPPGARATTGMVDGRNRAIAEELDRRNLPRAVKTNRLGVHPIMQQVPFDRFAVSCSIASDWDTRSVIRSSGLWTLPIDYTAGNFYPHVEDKTYANFGIVDQMVCKHTGKGRVVAFGDSTVYSNFLAFYPGKAEKLLGAVDWLNRRNRFDGVMGFGLWAAVAAFVVYCVVRLSRRPHVGYSAAVVSCGAAAAWTTLWACSASAQNWYAPPQAHTPARTVMFDMSYSDYKLPVFGFTQGSDYATSYEIFYQWVLRLGYFTEVSFDLEKTLQGPGPVVMIRPNKSLGRGLHRQLRAYLERGGDLVVIDSPNNGASTSGELLSGLGVAFGPPARGYGIVEPQTGSNLCSVRNALTVTGGQPLLTSNLGETLAAWAAVGEGRVVALGLGERFGDTQMGMSPRSVPNREVRAVFEIEFSLFRGLMESDLQAEMKQLGEIYRPLDDPLSAAR